MTGKGDTGQLGLGRSTKMCHEPTPLPVTVEIKYIAAGIAHSGMFLNYYHHTHIHIIYSINHLRWMCIYVWIWYWWSAWTRRY